MFSARRGIAVALSSVALAGVVAGCLSQSNPSPSVAQATPTPPAATSPLATATLSASPIAPPPGVGVTETDWGTIWDALPPGFPRYPGSTPTETGGPAASATLDVPADVPTATTWLQAELERAGFSTLSLSGPAEDGSMEIESMGPTDRCLVRTTVAPLGGSTIVTILYGAYCPPS
jgi:hypothetical protein